LDRLAILVDEFYRNLRVELEIDISIRGK